MSVEDLAITLTAIVQSLYDQDRRQLEIVTKLVDAVKRIDERVTQLEESMPSVQAEIKQAESRDDEEQTRTRPSSKMRRNDTH